MRIPVHEWTCSKHDCPQQCESCETWHCEECRVSAWVNVGERDATVWEEMLYQIPSAFAMEGQEKDKPAAPPPVQKTQPADMQGET